MPSQKRHSTSGAELPAAFPRAANLGEVLTRTLTNATAPAAKCHCRMQQCTAAANHPGTLKLLEDMCSHRTSKQKAADDLQILCDKEEALAAERQVQDEKARSVANVIDATHRSLSTYEQDHPSPTRTL